MIISVLTPGPDEVIVSRVLDGRHIVCHTFQGENIEVSDGYHTMHELYEHRMALNIALFSAWQHMASLVVDLGGDPTIEVMKSKLHHDGTMFEGYFIVMAVTEFGQISYHYKLKHWDKFKIFEVERTPEYDGHNSKDVLERLMKQ